MVTDYPQQITVSEVMGAAGESRFRSLLSVGLTRVQRTICRLRGHDSVLQFDQSRVFLQCMSCGHQSPGWRLERASARPGVLSVRPVPSSLALVRKVA